MKDKGYLRLTIMYGIYFLGLGATAFTAVYLGGKGMSNTQIGLLMSIAPLIALIFQPLWGMASDRAKYKRSVLALCFFASGIICLTYDFANSFVTLLIAMTLYSCVSQGLSPLAQSISMEYAADTKLGFGPIRMSGSIAYQLVVLLLGFILSDDMPQLFRIVCVCYMICAGYSLLLPPVKGYQHETVKISPFEVLKDRRVLFLLCMTFCGKTASMYQVSFYNKYMQELFSDSRVMSVLAFLAIVLEIPFLLLSNKVRKKMSITTWVLVGFAITAFRFIGIAVFTSAGLMTVLPKMAVIVILGLLQLPQMCVMACFEFYPSLYMNDIVPKELRGSMQSMNTLITFGITQLTGTLLGGLLADGVGMQNGFMIYGLFLVVALAVFLAPSRKMDMKWQF